MRLRLPTTLGYGITFPKHLIETLGTRALMSQGLLSRWRVVCKTLSDRDRTRILQRNGPVITIKEEALLRCEEKVRRRRSHGTPSELGAQKISASLTYASRQSNQTL